ncbi:tetratricopeptide repeat protein [Candidatus Bipolaricaulota bacterium]|nr:tetratricopeptide repeat protein [Candidatus Bipolaricaulota bacterium]
MNRPHETRRLSALMITDIVGYTRLVQRDERLALELLSEHNEAIRELLAAHGGREVKTMGDGFLVEFASMLQAVTCAVDIQKRFHQRNLEVRENRRFLVRIGLHAGDVVCRGEDVFGDGVNIASRIEPLAEPGGICLSQPAHGHVWNKLDMQLQSLGRKDLKNVEQPMEVYRVIMPWDKTRPDPLPSASMDRVAVLPLINISPDPDDAYFTDGMTEELIYTLSKVPGLKVIAQTSVMTYKGTDIPVRQIGRELGVGSVLEGSVRKSGDRVRITVQLIDAANEEHLWSQRYDRTLADVFSIQEGIAHDVAEELNALLHPAESRTTKGARKRPTVDLAAYTLYLRGRHFWSRRSREAMEKAIDYFRQAIAADPEFAVAYSGLADCYTVMANHGHARPGEAFPKAREAAQRAIELDPELAEAHASLGLVYAEFERDSDAAEREFRRAIALNPNYTSAHHWYANELMNLGRSEDALREIQLASELDPHSLMLRYANGAVLQELGRLEEARSSFRRALEVEPGFAPAVVSLAETEMTLWNWDEAERMLRDVLQRGTGVDPTIRFADAYVHLVRGNTRPAESFIQESWEEAQSAPMLAQRLGMLLIHLRRFDQAATILQRSRELHPENETTPLYLGVALLRAGYLDEAERCLDNIPIEQTRMQKVKLWSAVLRVFCAIGTGRHEQAEQLVAEIARLPQQVNQAYALAQVLLVSGHEDEGFAALSRAIAVRDPMLRELPIEQAFDPYRDDPRFQEALAILGLASLPAPSSRRS